MNSCLKYFSASLLALATQAAFAQVPDLGSADFAVLSAAPDGGGAVTCTDSTIIGDVGSSGLKASVTQTNCTITGAIIAPVSANVIKDFNDAYAALADVPCGTTLTGTLAGVTLTTPGVYCFDAAATLTGTLTLDGGATDTWLFKVGTSGTGALTGTNFSVVMTDSASACNVTWWVHDAVTMTTSGFQGIILAGAAITMTGLAEPTTSFNGDALAKAAVTLTNFSVIGCEGGSSGGKAKAACNQGVGNGPEDCDPGNSNQGQGTASNPFAGSNDELGGTPGDPGKKD